MKNLYFIVCFVSHSSGYALSSDVGSAVPVSALFAPSADVSPDTAPSTAASSSTSSLAGTAVTDAIASPSRRLIIRTPCVARPATRICDTSVRIVIPERMKIMMSLSSVTACIEIS